ncbi:twin-arginine translocase TatA/TatE family subunit [Parapedomonas caeni]|jgi:sec-independent protein translocase protein TatA
MGLGSIWHWMVLILVVVLLFGRGRISDIMGDVAKGIKSFKKGLSDEAEPAPPAETPRVVSGNAIDAKAEVKDEVKG